MLYLGGKEKLSRVLGPIVLEVAAGRPIWEPFCGGLGMSTAIRPAVASDYNAGLIALYQAVADGWDPPEHISEEEYRANRRLPTTNPLHAFTAFGCSFSGKEWGGYARDPKSDRNYCQAARKAVLRDVAALVAAGTVFECIDFVSRPVDPSLAGMVIYCDPPYAGTTGYGRQVFDYAGFVQKTREWARYCNVIVSEFSWPAEAGVELWQHERKKGTGGPRVPCVERIFRVFP